MLRKFIVGRWMIPPRDGHQGQQLFQRSKHIACR